MSNTNDQQSKKVFALAIKRTGKQTKKKSNSLLFYSDRKDAEEYASKVLDPDYVSLLDIECVIFECDIYHYGNPAVLIINNDCTGIPNFTPNK